MKIIRDEELGGLMMIPLLVDWGVRRCNVSGCTENPNTIVTGLVARPVAVGFCEKHYQQANAPSGCNFALDFDNFDAFEHNRRSRDGKPLPFTTPHAGPTFAGDGSGAYEEE